MILLKRRTEIAFLGFFFIMALLITFFHPLLHIVFFNDILFGQPYFPPSYKLLEISLKSNPCKKLNELLVWFDEMKFN